MCNYLLAERSPDIFSISVEKELIDHVIIQLMF